jgi:hypothetical protein
MAPRKNGNGTLRFNVQDFLRDMDNRLSDGQAALAVKVDEGFDRLASAASKIATDLLEHETADAKIAADVSGKLNTIARRHGNAKWVARAVIGAVIVFLFDILLNHNPFVK